MRISILFGFAMSLAAPAAAQNWTDRAEYDLVVAIRAEPPSPKKVALLEEWKKKYPATALRDIRAELYLATLQELGDWPRMFETAREAVAANPDGFVGLYWLTVLATTAKENAAEAWTASEKAAKTLLAGLDKHFAAGRMPAGMAAAEWQKERARTEVLAHRTLGWIEWQRGAYAAAEREFALCLEKDPRQAEISAWLGTVLALQKAPDKQLASIWHLARAAYTEDDEALPAAQRRDARAMLEGLYHAYHGSLEGIDEVGKLTAGGAFVPAGFQIETAAAAAERKRDEELNRTNPELAAWLRMRKRLEAPDGETYFAQSLSTAPLPLLKGFLIRYAPAARPKELILGVSDPAVEEVVIKLDSPLSGKAEPGVIIEFEGTASSFTRDPFTLIVAVEKDKLAGWPDRARK